MANTIRVLVFAGPLHGDGSFPRNQKLRTTGLVSRKKTQIDYSGSGILHFILSLMQSAYKANMANNYVTTDLKCGEFCHACILGEIDPIEIKANLSNIQAC